MKKSQHLIKLAEKLSNKYATVDATTIKDRIQHSIHQAVANASSQPSSGIMPFLKMLDQDQADMNIAVFRNGNNVTVSEVVVTPPQSAPRYAALPSQIQRYLERNIELFPSKYAGDDINYSNLSLTLSYPSNIQEGVATR
jgi:hypothetical protein